MTVTSFASYQLPDVKVEALQRVAGRLGNSGWVATTSKSLIPMVWWPVNRPDDAFGSFAEQAQAAEPLTSLDLWALDHLAQVEPEFGYTWEAKDVLR